MKRPTKLAAAIGAGGALLIGGTAAVTALVIDARDDRPAQSQMASHHGPMNNDGHTTGQGRMSQGYGRQDLGHGQQGQGDGRQGGRAGQGGHARMGQGHGMGAGGGPLALAKKGSLSAEQKTVLASMAEEEKLAHDLYTAFADRYNVPVFDRIAASESRHLQAVRTLLGRYEMTDPTAGGAAGSFTSPTVQSAYDELLAQGSKSEQDALKAGRQVEQTDIADLAKALNGLTAPDVRQTYTQLLSASTTHLNAFERQLTS
jgi:hypothetical protein